MFNFAFLSRRRGGAPLRRVKIDFEGDAQKILEAEVELNAIVRDVGRVVMDGKAVRPSARTANNGR